jgi:uncharacterized protein YndB with AHSA1/START domain
MTVINVEKDYENLQIVLTAEFVAPIEKVWDLWADPRKLERWWGPPTWPATFVEHSLVAGGTVTYYMTGPEGEKAAGWWKVTAVNPPSSLEFVDGFADPDGNPVDSLPTQVATVELTSQDGGTRMVMRSQLSSREHLDELLGMGMIEGLTESAGQMDAILAETA